MDVLKRDPMVSHDRSRSDRTIQRSRRGLAQQAGRRAHAGRHAVDYCFRSVVV